MWSKNEQNSLRELERKLLRTATKEPQNHVKKGWGNCIQDKDVTKENQENKISKRNNSDKTFRPGEQALGLRAVQKAMLLPGTPPPPTSFSELPHYSRRRVLCRSLASRGKCSAETERGLEGRVFTRK